MRVPSKKFFLVNYNSVQISSLQLLLSKKFAPLFQYSCSFSQINADGMIVDETTVRQRAAQKRNKESKDARLAQAVIATTVEMEVPRSMQLLPWS